MALETSKNIVLCLIKACANNWFSISVTPYHSPQGTPGEWVQDPYGEFGYVYTGPGFRLPFYIVSPWNRGGNVYVENADHNSQIKFVEEWLAAKVIMPHRTRATSLLTCELGQERNDNPDASMAPQEHGRPYEGFRLQKP